MKEISLLFDDRAKTDIIKTVYNCIRNRSA